MAKGKNQLGITAEYVFDAKDVANLIETGLNGARYWLELDKVEEPEVRSFGRGFVGEHALNVGGALILKNLEANNRRLRLDMEAITSGLMVMAKKEPVAFADFLTDNEDENTGDTFLQCALLGKVKYS
jgi:hypothetical protein